MSQERPWFKSYPQGVPHEVDLEQYRSIVSVFDEAISKYRDRPAFRNFGKTLTYGEIDKLSRQFAAVIFQHPFQRRSEDYVFADLTRLCLIAGLRFFQQMRPDAKRVSQF